MTNKVRVQNKLKSLVQKGATNFVVTDDLLENKEKFNNDLEVYNYIMDTYILENTTIEYDYIPETHTGTLWIY